MLTYPASHHFLIRFIIENVYLLDFSHFSGDKTFNSCISLLPFNFLICPGTVLFKSEFY